MNFNFIIVDFDEFKNLSVFICVHLSASVLKGDFDIIDEDGLLTFDF